MNDITSIRQVLKKISCLGNNVWRLVDGKNLKDW